MPLKMNTVEFTGLKVDASEWEDRTILHLRGRRFTHFLVQLSAFWNRLRIICLIMYVFFRLLICVHMCRGFKGHNFL